MGQGWPKALLALLTTKTFSVLAAIRQFFLGTEGKAEEKEEFPDPSFPVSSFEEGLMTSCKSVRQLKWIWVGLIMRKDVNPTDHVGE